jgi:hypothetical protein
MDVNTGGEAGSTSGKPISHSAGVRVSTEQNLLLLLLLLLLLCLWLHGHFNLASASLIEHNIKNKSILRIIATEHD